MKLGLLVVLAVAVLVPNLSEGRIVSRCELKEKLGQVLVLPRKLQRFKDRILATVICEVEMKSQLNTGLVKVSGNNRTSIIKPTVPELTQDVKNHVPRMHAYDKFSRENSMDFNSVEDERIGEETDATSDDSHMTDMEYSMEMMLDEEESKFDEEEMEQGLEEGERSVANSGQNRGWRSRSLGYHGLFQLSDSIFCDSGNRWTKNVCKTSCQSFTDDDIKDDIDCFVKSRYWQYLLTTARYYCFRISNFFNECT